MNKLIWMRGLMGALAHLTISLMALMLAVMIGIGMAELARYLASLAG